MKCQTHVPKIKSLYAMHIRIRSSSIQNRKIQKPIKIKLPTFGINTKEKSRTLETVVYIVHTQGGGGLNCIHFKYPCAGVGGQKMPKMVVSSKYTAP